MNKHFRRLALILATSAAAACSTGGGERIDATRRGMTDAAAGPLRDVGIIRPSVPDLLETLRYPYSTNTLSGGCPSVLYEIGALDAVLGLESYQPGQETTLTERGMEAASDAAVDLARDATDVIPFRGWVRRASGAAKAERDAARATELGHTRRAFLRGYGAALNCPGVTPAPPVDRRKDEAAAQTSEQQGVSAPP
jgi:hypothetical protein